jgi:tRNA(Ile)-lysidine synthetase-like protein
MLLQEDEEALDGLATRLAAALLARGRDGVAASPPLREQPRAVVRRALHKFIGRYVPGEAPCADALDDALEKISAGNSFRFSLGGTGFLVFTGEQLRFEPPAQPAPVRAPALLPVPGAVFWPDGAVLSARPGPAVQSPGPAPGTGVSILFLDACFLRCASRVVGERYRPFGSPGSQKLGDAMTNRKIPPASRDALPVVRSGGEILWCPGLLPSENYRCSESENRALRLTWTAPGAT